MKQGWEYGTLEKAVKKGSSNISLNKIKDDNGEYPVFSAKGFAKNVSFFQQEKEYLAIIKDGAGIGRVAKYPAKSSVVATMQYLIPNEGFDIGFIEYFLNGIDFEKHRSGSTIPHVYFKDYKREAFPLIPLPEQQRIVKILDKAFVAIDKAKQNAEQNLKNAKEVFENYQQGVFEGKGEEKKLGEVVSAMMTGPFGSMLHKSDYVENGIPVVNPQNIINGEIIPLQKTMISEDTLKKLEKYALRENDIIIARRGEMGRCAIVKKKNIGWLCGTGSLVIRVDKNKTDETYLAFYLSSSKIKMRLENSSIGTTMSNLNQKILSELHLTLPSIKEQRFVIKNINALSGEINKLENIYLQKISNTEELKKSILQKAFEGGL